jgi:Concanavalin A-like lectin/glucanases superfamily
MKRSPFRHRALLAALTAATVAALCLPTRASALDFGRLTAWWPLAEGSGQVVHDLSGNGNNGTLGSTPGPDANDPTWIKGIFFGNALRFDGVDDFVAIPAAKALEQPQFTVSLWTRAPVSPGPFKYLLAKGSQACTAASYGITTDQMGGVFFYIWDGHNFVRSGGVPVDQIWDGRWHNLTGTYDGTRTELFIDGRSTGQPPGSSSSIVYGLPDPTTTIGGYRGSCDLLFKGDLDQVMMFDKVLPVATIWGRFGWLLGSPTMN